jgi:hypothetical protein
MSQALASESTQMRTMEPIAVTQNAPTARTWVPENYLVSSLVNH